MLSTSHVEYLSEQGDLDRRAREVGREDVLVEEYGAMVLGDHVEVLRQGTVSDKACTFLHADNLPRAVEVACQTRSGPNQHSQGGEM